MTSKKSVLPSKAIEHQIILLRQQKVMLSTHLAHLYQVEPRVLVQAVKRNIDRFPNDFMFQLNNHEFNNLKSQFANAGWGGLRKPPYAFTEQGIAMLSTVLNSKRAIQVNIQIMRAFVRMRKMLSEYEDLSRKLDALEKKNDIQFKAVFDAIRQLMEPPQPKKKQIGFHWDETPEPSRKRPPAKKQAPAKKK